MAKVIRDTKPDAYIELFETTDAVLQFATKNHTDVAFISMENDDGRGFFLVKELKVISPRTNVIAVAQHYHFMQAMNRLRVSGYITETLTTDIVADELANLRY